jgi:hypothetical protein
MNLCNLSIVCHTKKLQNTILNILEKVFQHLLKTLVTTFNIYKIKGTVQQKPNRGQKWYQLKAFDFFYLRWIFFLNVKGLVPLNFKVVSQHLITIFIRLVIVISNCGGRCKLVL